MKKFLESGEFSTNCREPHINRRSVKARKRFGCIVDGLSSVRKVYQRGKFSSGKRKYSVGYPVTTAKRCKLTLDCLPDRDSCPDFIERCVDSSPVLAKKTSGVAVRLEINDGLNMVGQAVKIVGKSTGRSRKPESSGDSASSAPGTVEGRHGSADARSPQDSGCGSQLIGVWPRLELLLLVQLIPPITFGPR